MTSSSFQPKRILIVPLRYIGDTILTAPLIRNVHHQFPNAEIDVLCSQTTASVMQPCPYIRQVLVEPKGTSKRIQLLKDGQYDAIFILRKSVSMAIMALLAGIPHRIGYDKQRYPFGYKRWGWFLTHKATYPSLKTTVPQAVSHLGLLKSVVGESQTLNSSLELWTTPEDESKIDHLLGGLDLTDSKAPIAIWHAASASHGKQIALDKFADSLALLAENGYTLFVTGTASDTPAYEAIKQRFKLPLHILSGRTTLRETVALYKRAQLLLTVDSSPIHMAAAVGIPRVVGVFGPTNDAQWGPHFPAYKVASGKCQFFPVFLQLDCRPCYAKVCSHNQCRESLTSGQIKLAVYQAIQSIS